MILRIDRLQTELPPPSDPDPDGASVVQELMGGKFGEMSTLMNYTFQSFNFRDRQGARPVLRPDREHRGGGVRPHRARRRDDQHDAHRRDADRHRKAPGKAMPGLKACATPSTSSPAARARCRRTRTGKPWNGDYVFSSGDLVEDLTHNFFLETGARNGKLRVYEMCRPPGRARAHRATCSCAAASTRSRTRGRSRTSRAPT